MSEWTDKTLAELADPSPYSLATGPFGSAISSTNFVKDGVPVLRGSNLSLNVGTRLNDDGLAFLTNEKAATFKRSVASRGDLVFTCWGTVGQIGLVDKRSKFEEYIVSNKQMKLTPDRSKIESLFLYYLLSSPEMVAAVTGQAIGAAVPGFNLGQLKSLTVKIPCLSVQRKISTVLGAIDDLIENNRRRIGLLEQMAQAIYREWFVKFRYPGHEHATFVDSPLGPIPSDWSVASASTVLEINPKVKLSLGDSPFISMGDVGGTGMVCFASEKRAGGSGSKFENHDTLFARITPCLENGKTAFVQCLPEGVAARGSTEFVVLRGRLVGPAFTYLLALSEPFRSHAIASMSGASGRQRVRNECLILTSSALPLQRSLICLRR